MQVIILLANETPTPTPFFRTLWHTENWKDALSLLFLEHGYWLICGIVLGLLGILLYFYITVRYWEILKHKKFRKKIAHTLIYIPDDGAVPLPQITAAVLVILGFCLIVSTIFSHLSSIDLNVQSLSFTLTGFMFSIIMSFFVFWTLWQTRKIEHKTGYNITSFQELIKQLTEDLDDLYDDFNEKCNKIAAQYHRVYLVTTNPFFGMLTSPGHTSTTGFRDNLRRMASCLNDSHIKNTNPKFVFEIVCGDDNALLQFHKEFYSDRQNGDQLAQDKTAAAINEIKILKTNSGNLLSLYQVKEIPPTQFMIIGNKIYEFILDATSQRTEIHDAEVREDRRTCEKYIETFKLLKKLP